jgi:hypothetical protein
VKRSPGLRTIGIGIDVRVELLVHFGVELGNAFPHWGTVP